jgi:hypothetical protein
MKKENEDKITIILSFAINSMNKELIRGMTAVNQYSMIPPMIWKGQTGFYQKKNNELKKTLNFFSQAEILQAISVLGKTNAFTIKKITKYSYPFVHKSLKQLKYLRLVVLEEGKSDMKKREISVRIHPNVKVLKLSDCEEEIDKSYVKDKALAFENEQKYLDYVKKESNMPKTQKN